MAGFSHLSFDSMLYMGVGHLPIPIFYFCIRKEWSKRNNPENKADQFIDKVLFMTWDNRFDWKAIFLCMTFAII